MTMKSVSSDAQSITRHYNYIQTDTQNKNDRISALSEYNPIDQFQETNIVCVHLYELVGDNKI